MKENKYDDPRFFEKYSHMSRSEQGLQGAGEWLTLAPLLPAFAGKRVLDLGCGYGWHCAYAADQGAASVIGVDLSAKMLETARAKNARPQVQYQQGAIEDAAFPDGSFDIVLSSLALHYVADFDAVARRVYAMVAPGGWFVFSAEHPIFTAQGPQDWDYDESGRIRHFPVDHYFCQGPRNAVFLGEPVRKYHRTLTAYLEGLLCCGFALRHVVEPQPPEEMLDMPGMRDELRRPLMLIVCAQKP